MNEASDTENEGRRRLLTAPFALLPLWGLLVWAIWREGWTTLNQALLAVITLWSAYRLFTYFRR